MTVAHEQACLQVRETTAFLYAAGIQDILAYKTVIDKSIADDQIKVLVIICEGQRVWLPVATAQREALYKWLNALPVLSIAAADTYCCDTLLELLMMCDMRLGGARMFIGFPETEPAFVFDFEARCQLLMGKLEEDEGYRQLLGTVVFSKTLCKCGFINRIIDMDDLLNEVQSYIDKVIGSKDSMQIKAIIKCFNHYKQLGLNTSQELLLEQESKQFCYLIAKEYLKKQEIK